MGNLTIGWRGEGRAALVVLVALALNGSAEAGENLYFSSLPVVASVSRLQQPLSEAPGAVTVIDRDMIRASGARNIADLLRLVPGFSVTAPNQEPAVVAYHGLSNEEYTPRVQVLVDGRSLYSPLFKSGVNWNLIPVTPEDIERIEVMRGSNSVSFGSNAFLGVINIITQHSSLASGVMIAGNTGNQSIADQTVRWGGRVGSTDVRVTVRQLNDGGLRKMYDGSLGWFDPHDSRHGQLFDLRADIPLSDRDELQVSVNHVYDVSQFGRPKNIGDPMRDLSQSNSSVSAEWHRTISASEDMKLRFSRVEDWMSGRFVKSVSYKNVQGVDVRYDSTQYDQGKSITTELDFQHIFAPGQRTRMVWGASINAIMLSSMQQFSSTDWKRRNVLRSFFNLEWRPLDALVLNGGASVERDSISGTHVDPRLAASYHVTPNHTLRLIASRAHRTPSLYEARGDWQAAPVNGTNPMDRVYYAASGLQAERIDTLEAGYLGEFKDLRSSLDVRWFNESIPNRIAMVPYPLPPGVSDDRDSTYDRTHSTANYLSGRADAALNLEKVSIRGVEYQWRWQPFESTRLIYGHAYVSVYANLTNPFAISDGQNGTGETIEKIPRQTRESAPRHSTSAMLIQRLPYGIEASVMYYKTGYMRWLRNSFTMPYERVDWRLAKSFRIGQTRGEIAYTAQSANEPQQGRRDTRIVNEMHWVTLRLDF